jgi:NADH dehydrogenase
VILLDAASRVLPVYTPALSESARRQLEKSGVEVRLEAMVEDLNDEGVRLKTGELISARTVIWAAGNAASSLGASLGVPVDRQGRVIINSDLSIPGHPEVQVIGDLANFTQEDGTTLPGLSPVAMQQGRHAAKNVRSLIAGGWTYKFSYFDKGSMATIGRHAAVADVRGLRITGLIAWLAWLFVHLIFLISFRNKVMVFLNWAYIYFTFGRHARLITGREWKESAVKAPVPKRDTAPELAGIGS